jgi:hypothetical protein
MAKRREDRDQLLQWIYREIRELRNEQRKTNDRLTPLEKLVRTEAVKQETDYTTADFGDKEAAIIDYVKRNPGQSKKKITAAFDNAKGRSYNGQTISPPVTHKKINELEKDYSVFEFRPDPNHQQKQCVYINDKSLLLNINKTLDDFKEALIVAIDTVNSKVTEDKTVDTTTVDDSSDSSFPGELLMYYAVILSSYQHFVSMVMLQALFDWPQTANINARTLKRAYQILFVKLNEIQQALKESLDKTDMVDVRASMITKSWLMRPDMMLYALGPAQKLNVLPQLKRLYTTAWNISQNDFDLVKPMFTPDSLIRHDESKTTRISLPFDDKPVSWQKALEPGIVGLDIHLKPKEKEEKNIVKG